MGRNEIRHPMLNIRPSAFLVLAAFGACALPSEAQEWTRFRGPNGTGVSEAKNIPVAWTEKDFRWRIALPGEGHSNPVIWGDQIFIESAQNGGSERMMLCLRKED